jgi:transcriptional regulator with XRE-family HTH domain
MDAMSHVQRRSNQLGDFLKARRAQLTPHDVGLPESGTHRKVEGLRREEVAQLAAISVDYLTRLEQGRVRASGSVLITLSRALRLDDDQQAYLCQLAGKAPQPRRRPVQQTRPAMRRLLVADQRSRAGLGTKRPVGPAGAGDIAEPLEGAGRALRYCAARRRLNQLDERPAGENDRRRVIAGALRCCQRLLVAAQAVTAALAAGPGQPRTSWPNSPTSEPMT